MNDPLYNKPLLTVAARATGAGRLDPRDATATAANPLCGDRVTIDLRLSDGKISAIAHDVHACVLCQAAAVLLAERLPGLEPAAISAMADRVRQLIGQDEDATAEAAGEFAIFNSVRAIPARRRCVMLPFEAAVAAGQTLMRMTDA